MQCYSITLQSDVLLTYCFMMLYPITLQLTMYTPITYLPYLWGGVVCEWLV